MAKSSAITEEVTLAYAQHEFDPLPALDFIQSDGFNRNWKRLRLDDEDLRILRIMIAAAPTRPPVVPSTGGLRKLRFSPPKSHAGKSRGVRVCYAFYSTHGIVLLIGVYAKNQKVDLTARERNSIKTQLEQFERHLDRKPLH